MNLSDYVSAGMPDKAKAPKVSSEVNTSIKVNPWYKVAMKHDLKDVSMKSATFTCTRKVVDTLTFSGKVDDSSAVITLNAVGTRKCLGGCTPKVSAEYTLKEDGLEKGVYKYEIAMNTARGKLQFDTLKRMVSVSAAAHSGDRFAVSSEIDASVNKTETGSLKVNVDKFVGKAATMVDKSNTVCYAVTFDGKGPEHMLTWYSTAPSFGAAAFTVKSGDKVKLAAMAEHKYSDKTKAVTAVSTDASFKSVVVASEVSRSVLDGPIAVSVKTSAQTDLRNVWAPSTNKVGVVLNVNIA